MPNPPLTRRQAYLQAEEAANRRMRSQGRRWWDEDDYYFACEVFERLVAEEKRTVE